MCKKPWSDFVPAASQAKPSWRTMETTESLKLDARRSRRASPLVWGVGGGKKTDIGIIPNGLVNVSVIKITGHQKVRILNFRFDLQNCGRDFSKQSWYWAALYFVEIYTTITYIGRLLLVIFPLHMRNSWGPRVVLYSVSFILFLL